jgi:hypothetical protein
MKRVRRGKGLAVTRKPKNELRLVVLGIMGRTPFAGVAWQGLHYLEGLRRMGYDVHYVEDTGEWTYDAEQNTITDDCSYTLRYIAQLMNWCGLSDRWAYRSGADGRTYGLSESQVSRLFEEADALINLTGATLLRDTHRRVPVRIYLETDPVLPQIQVALGSQFRIDLLNAHTHHFTYGENVGTPDCILLTDHFDYHPTRQPVILDWWKPTTSTSFKTGHAFTTIASWNQSQNDIEWNGEIYKWSKHYEFLKFIDLPRQAGQRLELALACSGAKEKLLFPQSVEQLKAHGWQITDAIAVSKDMLPYRDYIWGSRGEFTVAKDQNIRLHTGWFSDRSACYLAAGCPVVTQNTGFGTVLPTGEGLFAFNTTEDILIAFDQINSNYQRHSRAARAIAEEYFRAEKVLAKVIADSGL